MAVFATAGGASAGWLTSDAARPAGQTAADATPAGRAASSSKSAASRSGAALSRSATASPTALGSAPASASATGSGGTAGAAGSIEAELAGAVAAVEASSGARLGVAVLAAGGAAPVSAGSWPTGHAWSTAKVPVAIAALAADGSPANDALAAAAITLSDNAAAEQLWTGLGDSDQAGSAVDAVLREAGSATGVQRTRTRPEYTAFGQTTWSLADQAGFAARFPGGQAADRVWALMDQIDSSQSWGLGRFAGAHFKGGWGPDDSGYVVRQFGQVPVASGCAAIAIGGWAPSFEAGTAALDGLAQALLALSDRLPAGPCR
ncbi:MAG: hypothetical protein LBG60_09605 [Bifidobacteriaceae bacterium]|nr:hypothetical protein [Bifidobacteriaceae bacterium]